MNLDLNLIWFVLLGVLLTGYAILDGFDLGVGILHLFAKGDTERRIFMNAIGPVWDGNEVWLVTFGGALFAAFPEAYATAFSGFYIPFMILLFALIFRAVAMEFRSKENMTWWRKTFDRAFFAASLVATLLFGVAVGNMMLGIPIGPGFEYEGTMLDLLRPYALLVGLFTVSLFAMHGAIYLYLKTEGALQMRVRRWIWRAFFVFLLFFATTTAVTLIHVPTALYNFTHFPWAWIVVALTALAIANIPRCIHFDKPGWAFVSSACTIAAMVFLFGIAVFPDMILSSLDPEYSLTIYNAASSEKTLGIMLVIAAVGMPIVLAYTSIIYYIFRGKVKIDRFSY
ncbi:MAG: cytochrome d ubiquinol oxidase subunit II [bacterium]|jgi:cytochrome d ubiquinol oxidase subunit II